MIKFSSDTAAEFLTTSDAAKLLGRTAQTVRSYEAAGRLRAVRTAGGWRLFLRADVERLLAARTRLAEAKG